MTRTNPLVSIITVNYYSEDEIIQCLESIINYTSASFEYIVVSNSKIDNEFTTKLDSYSCNTFVKELDENFGFATACNIGSDLASGEYLFFLNPDTRFNNDVIIQLIQCAKENSNAGIIGPKTLSSSKRVSATAKDHLSPDFFLYLMIPFYRFFSDERKTGGHFIPENSGYVPVLNGHALFLSRAIYQKLNGMDEHFFMYWEENDLCLRAKRMGYQTLFCSEAELTHYKGTSTNPFFLKMEIEKHRSQKKYVSKHLQNYKLINRISGIIGYSWRVLFSLFTFDKKKVSQHFTVLKWYLFTYK
jgi:hypothetical protein